MIKIAPSILSADFADLGRDVERLSNAGADFIHIDVMDGHFVPNISFGMPVIKAIRNKTDKVFDVHLMIENPSKYIDDFIDAGADIITIHYESEKHLDRTIAYIKAKGKKAAVALNPATPVHLLKNIIAELDMVLIMSVNPGFAGQKYLNFVDDKFKQFCAKKEEFGYKVMIDGACSPERIAMLSSIGVEGFILGTSALFGKEKSYQEIIKELRGL